MDNRELLDKLRDHMRFEAKVFFMGYRLTFYDGIYCFGFYNIRTCNPRNTLKKFYNYVGTWTMFETPEMQERKVYKNRLRDEAKSSYNKIGSLYYWAKLINHGDLSLRRYLYERC